LPLFPTILFVLIIDEQILSLEGSFPSLACWPLAAEQLLLMLCYWSSRWWAKLFEFACPSLFHLCNDSNGTGLLLVFWVTPSVCHQCWVLFLLY